MSSPRLPIPSRQSLFRRPSVAVLLAIAAGLHVAALVRAEPLQSANDRSRWATVWSLAERGTFRIDAIDRLSGWSTIDKVQVDGHLYSSKPALLTVMTAGIYAALRSVTGWSIIEETALVTQTILGLINLIPWLLAWLAVAAMARKYARTRFTRVFVVGTAAFGTFLSTYSVTFNNHTIAAVSLLFALFFATRIVIDGSRRPLDFLLCGLTSAFVTTNELPAALFGLAIFGLLAWHDWRRTFFLFVPAALIPIGAFFVTTWLQTGSWKPFYLSYGTETYIFIRDGLPSYWANPRGIDRNLDSPPVYLFHCIFGHHGILSLSPVFLLTLAGWCMMRRSPNAILRPFNMMGLVLTITIVTFYMTRTENYNYGGNTVALRWAMWLIPFWILGLIPILDALAQRRWFRIIAVVLLGISTFSAWEAFANPWRPSWLFRSLAAAELINYDNPPAVLEKPLSTVISKLPAAEANPEQSWVELTALTETGRETIRVSLVSADTTRVKTKWTRTETGTGIPTHILETINATWDRSAFERGALPQESLIAGDPSRTAALRRFQGLSRAVKMRPRRTRHIKIPGWEYAFLATQATGVVDVRRQSGDILRHRIDIWVCQDVPFGVIRMQYTLQQAESGQILERRDYILSDTGRPEIPDWVRRIEALE